MFVTSKISDVTKKKTGQMIVEPYVDGATSTSHRKQVSTIDELRFSVSETWTVVSFDQALEH